MAASVLNTFLRQNEVGPHENSLARPPMAPAGIRKPPCSIQHELAWRRNGGCGIALLFSGNRSQSQPCTLDLRRSMLRRIAELPVQRGMQSDRARDSRRVMECGVKQHTQRHGKRAHAIRDSTFSMTDNSQIEHRFAVPIYTRYIRIVVLEWINHISMRAASVEYSFTPRKPRETNSAWGAHLKKATTKLG